MQSLDLRLQLLNLVQEKFALVQVELRMTTECLLIVVQKPVLRDELNVDEKSRYFRSANNPGLKLRLWQ